MKQIVTQAIVLARTNYGEADRILTVLTPDHGKRRLLAKGVRKSKSKMAGGIELFSVAEISYIQGKGDIDTLTSSRLGKHYDGIAKHIERTMTGYDLLKLLNRSTEDQPEAEYFTLLQQLLVSLHDHTVNLDVVRLWFYAQLLQMAGHAPNLQTDTSGTKLDPNKTYLFSYEDMAFTDHPNGTFTAKDIKFLRLLFGRNQPEVLQKIADISVLLPASMQLVRTVVPNHIKM